MFKDGLENFTFEIIEECKKDSQILNEREKYWIKYYDSFNNGYNSSTSLYVPTVNDNPFPKHLLIFFL